mmetsp:Transcript_28862/g.47694  ORF Transcript_28862/g.47694 Transcript_28862/m.47694 type:complete len:489 (+) Transcript_28862:60-1526(+)
MQRKISGGRKRTNTAGEPMQVGLVPGEPLSPVSERTTVKKQDEVPTTPNVECTRANPATPGVSTPEETLAPKPCRAFLGSPGGASLADSNAAADEPEQELRKLFHGRHEEAQRMFDKDRQHARAGDVVHSEQNRPLSSISTSAGPTPSPDGRTSPGFTPSSAGPGRRGNAGKLRAFESDAGRDVSKALPAQVRKVFVGGIPQDMQQEGLTQLFSEWAPVKKAWVQRFKDVTKSKVTQTTHNHRGFGFVIFHDTSAVDQILGNADSKFIKTRDGHHQLEVKRAISSSEMPDGARQAPDDSNPSKGRGFQHKSPPVVSEPAGHAPQVPRMDQGQGAPQQSLPQNCGWPSGVMQSQPAAAHPWPTTGGDVMQQMQNQQVQQLVPAMAGYPMAMGPPGPPGPGMVMQTMNWMPAGAPSYAMPAAHMVPMAQCGDGTQPSAMQHFFNTAAPWQAPNAWHMQMTAAAPFTQPQPVAVTSLVWHAPNGQPAQVSQ